MKATIRIPYPAADYVPDDQVQIVNGMRYHKVGNVIEHPDAWKLVHGGIADAADDECSLAADARGNPNTVGWMAKAPVRIMREFVEYRSEKEADAADAEEVDADTL